MSNPTYSAHAFQPVAGESLLVSLFMATPLYVFAAALTTALRATSR